MRGFKMKTAEKIAIMREAEADLPHILDELSFSYSVVYSAQQSLEDLNKSINELEELTTHLNEHLDKAAS